MPRLARVSFVSLVAVVAFAAVTSTASAAPVLFYGFDQAAGAGPTPNSDAAYAAFLSGLAPGSLGLEDFEDETPGGFPSIPVEFLPLAETGTIADLAAFGSQILVGNTPDYIARSGSRMLQSAASGGGDFFELTFTNPTYAFGFFGSSFSDYAGFPTGPGTIPPIAVSLDGGALIDAIAIDPIFVMPGSINFFGVISDTAFTTVRLVNPFGTSNDGIAIDDLVIGAPLEEEPAPVPEPGTLALFGAGALLVANRIRRPRR